MEHCGAETCQTPGAASMFYGSRESGREEGGALVGVGGERKGELLNSISFKEVGKWVKDKVSV